MKDKVHRGLYEKPDGTFGMIYCPNCEMENYSLAVHSGICYNCGYDANTGKHILVEVMEAVNEVRP